MNVNAREGVINNSDSMTDGELLTCHVIHFLRKLFFENRNTKFYGAISASQEKECAKQGKEKHHILQGKQQQ
jgi:hypothetical protein